MRQFYEGDGEAEAVACAVEDRAEREMERMEKRWEKERAAFVDQIKHMANTAHQAFHTDFAGVGWLDCPRPFCADARRSVGEK